MDLPTRTRGALAVAVAVLLPLVLCGAVPADDGAGPSPASTCLAGPDHVFVFGETPWSHARGATDGLRWSRPTAVGPDSVWPCATWDRDRTGSTAGGLLRASATTDQVASQARIGDVTKSASSA